MEFPPLIRGKTSDQRSDLHLQVGPPFQGGGADIGSQVDIDTCTDACNYAQEGVGLFEQAYSDTHVCM